MQLSVNFTAVILLAAALFCIGLFGALSRKSALGILMSLEMMGMAIAINLITLGRFVSPHPLDSWFFTVFLMVIAAAEIGIGLALIVALYRRSRTSEVDELDQLKG
ncbi:MAG: NADH-quinone oxidoreductase subunit NuoK [Actinomycetia bacterium]|nr:NADH-quinone oxidoreductase subunit NuoK [Actinomycetes bacterium]